MTSLRQKNRINGRGLVAGLLCCALLPTLTGCWDRFEINDLAIVLVTAVDFGDDENSYRVSVQFPLTGKLGGTSGGGGGSGEGGGGKPYYVDAATGTNLRECSDAIQRRLSRRLSYSHRRIILVSERVARKSIRELFDLLSRHAENRLSSILVVVEGEAVDYLYRDTNVERFSAEFIRELVKMNAPAALNMKNAASAMVDEFTDPVFPYIGIRKHRTGKETNEQLELLGYAQFKKERMVDVFRSDEAVGIVWLKRFDTYTDTFHSDDHAFSAFLTQGRIRTKSRWDDAGTHFHINVYTQATLLEYKGARNVNSVGEAEQIEKIINEQIARQILAAISKMKQHKTDNAGFGFELYRLYPLRWKQAMERRWDERITNAKFTVTVHSVLEDVGFTSDNLLH